jgi:hypothetical protein
MSCPDPEPPPGSVQDLENQKYLLERRIRDKKNQDFLASGRLDKMLEELALVTNLTQKERAGKSWEELLQLSIDKARKTQSAYTDSLWAKRK